MGKELTPSWTFSDRIYVRRSAHVMSQNTWSNSIYAIYSILTKMMQPWAKHYTWLVVWQHWMDLRKHFAEPPQQNLRHGLLAVLFRNKTRKSIILMDNYSDLLDLKWKKYWKMYVDDMLIFVSYFLRRLVGKYHKSLAPQRPSPAICWNRTGIMRKGTLW